MNKKYLERIIDIVVFMACVPFGSYAIAWLMNTLFGRIIWLVCIFVAGIIYIGLKRILINIFINSK